MSESNDSWRGAEKRFSQIPMKGSAAGQPSRVRQKGFLTWKHSSHWGNWPQPESISPMGWAEGGWDWCFQVGQNQSPQWEGQGKAGSDDSKWDRNLEGADMDRERLKTKVLGRTDMVNRNTWTEEGWKRLFLEGMKSWWGKHGQESWQQRFLEGHNSWGEGVKKSMCEV